MPDRVVVDIAGAVMGGAARWVAELDGFLSGPQPSGVTVLGRDRRITPGWLVRREHQAARTGVAVASNNVSFAIAGARRVVVLRNALHFLRPAEEHLLAAMPRAFRGQIPVVRGLLGRAEVIVAPSWGMAERVCRLVPAARSRVVVRPHPVTPVGPRLSPPGPFLLVPVLPAPYKNLLPQLAGLLAALDRAGSPLTVRVTARHLDLPEPLRRHPRVVALGTVPHHRLAGMWRQATAAFFPSAVEAFGYPLAEARVYGVPVLSPDSAQAREIAGAALLPYRPGEPASLAEAVERLAGPVAAEPDAFDRDGYFRWLFGLPDQSALTSAGETHGTAT